MPPDLHAALNSLGLAALTFIVVSTTTKISDLSKKLHENTGSLQEISHQVKNDHSTNFREDMDKNTDLTREVSKKLDCFYTRLDKNYQGIQDDIRNLRKDLQLEMLERTNDIREVKDMVKEKENAADDEYEQSGSRNRQGTNWLSRGLRKWPLG